MLLLFLLLGGSIAVPIEDSADETDGGNSRKILGSSVVTSVSVIMDTGNGSHAYFLDAVGKPMSKPAAPAHLASPINLLNPDRYEFYTFDDSGDLVKRLMTLDEIQGIIANGDGESLNYNSQSMIENTPEKRVDDIVSNVQNVLKEEMEAHKTTPNSLQTYDTPDVSSSWSMILPAVFGNSGENIKPNRPQAVVTPPDIIMLEQTTVPPFLVSVTNENIQKPVTITPYSRSTDGTPATDAPHAVTEIIIPDNSLDATKEGPITILVETTSSSKPTVSNVDIFIKPNVTTIEIKNATVPAEEKTESSPFTMEQSETQNSTKYMESLERATTIPSVSTTSFEKLESAVNYNASSTEFIKIHYITPPNKIENLENHKSSTATPPSESTSSVTKRKTSSTTSSTIEILKQSTEVLNSSSIDLSSQNVKESESFNQFQLTTKDQLITNDGPFSSKDNTTKSSVSDLVLNSLKEHVSSESTELIELNSESDKTTPAAEKIYAPIISSVNANLDKLSNTTFNENKNISGSSESQVPVTEFNVTDTNQKNSNFSSESLLKENLSAANSIKINSVFNQPNISTETTRLPGSSTSIEQTVSINYGNTTRKPIENLATTQIVLNTHPIQAIKNNTFTTTQASGVKSSQQITEISTEKSSNIEQDLDQQLLDQFHFTTTIVYDNKTGTTQYNLATENFETMSKTDTPEDMIKATYNSSSTIAEDQDKIPTTDKYSETRLIATDTPEILKTDNLVQTTSGDILMSNIEQIISQATSYPEEVVEDTEEERYKVQQLMKNSYGKPLSEIQAETATMASSMVENVSKDNKLTEAIDSLISQIVGPETTIIPAIATTSENIALKEQAPETTTKQSNLTDSTEKLNRYEEIDLNTNFTKPSDTLSTTDRQNNSSTEDYISETTEIKVSSSNINQSSELLNELNTEQSTLYFENQETQTPTEYLKISQAPAKVDMNLETNENTFTEKIINMDNIPVGEDGFISIPTEAVTEVTSLIQNSDDSKVATTLKTNVESITIGTETDSLDETTSIETISENSAKTDLPSNVTSEKHEIPRTTEFPEKLETTTFFDSTLLLSTVNVQGTETVPKHKPEESEVVKPVISKLDSTSPKTELTWKLVPTVAPHNVTPENKPENQYPVNLVPQPQQGFGLEDSTSALDTDVYQFTELCNELAFSFWNSVTRMGISPMRSITVSPFAATSLLAMVFLGARGATSGEMNEILKLDDMVTFNPHLIFKNVSESIEVSKKAGVAASAIIRELYSDKSKGKLLGFYKERAKQFYDGHVEEVGFKGIGDVVRRRTNLLVKRQTWGKVHEYLKDNTLTLRPPLAAVSASIFQTDCSMASVGGRDGELYFVVSPTIRQRKLVPIPAVVWRSGFLAGYDPSLDATAVSIGTKDQTVSTIFVIPGQQGIAAPGDGLARLEVRLTETSFKQSSWSRLLRSLIPRPGLEVQIPRFSHRSVINATVALQRMGLKDLFNSEKADLRGLNGVAHELHLSDMLQVNTFQTCGEGRTDETHHSETYPASANRSFRRRYRNMHKYKSDKPLYDIDALEEPRDYQRSFHDPVYDPSFLSLPLPLRPRQARLPEAPRLRLDRPFLYFVRHNPTGLILHMGRFNPRLLP